MVFWPTCTSRKYTLFARDMERILPSWHVSYRNQVVIELAKGNSNYNTGKSAPGRLNGAAGRVSESTAFDVDLDSRSGGPNIMRERSCFAEAASRAYAR